MIDICGVSRQAIRMGVADVYALLQGSSRSRIKGEGMEYVDFRPYAPGDDIRYVDWRMSARRTGPGKTIDLVVKEFMSEKMVNTLIAVDMSSQLSFKEKIAGSLYTASLMTSLAGILEDRVYIGIIRDDRYRVFVPHRPRDAIYYLANTVCREKPSGGEIDSAVLFADMVRKTRMIRGGVLITDYSHRPDYIKSLKNLFRARRLGIALIYMYDWAEINPLLDEGFIPICSLSGECIVNDIGEIYKAIREHVQRIRAVSRLITPYMLSLAGLQGARANKLRIMDAYLSIRTRKSLVSQGR